MDQHRTGLRIPREKGQARYRPPWSVLKIDGFWFASRRFETEQEAELFIRQQQEPDPPREDSDDSD